MKAVDPVPFDVFVDSAIVGFGDVDQTTPFDVIEDPPSVVTVPPDVADVCPTALIAVVVKDGMLGAFVVKVTVEP